MMLEQQPQEQCPAWVRCELCGDYICLIHETHVADCACTLEDFERRGINPYMEGGPTHEQWTVRRLKHLLSQIREELQTIEQTIDSYL